MSVTYLPAMQEFIIFVSDRQMSVCLWGEQQHWDVEPSMLSKSRWVTYHQAFLKTNKALTEDLAVDPLLKSKLPSSNVNLEWLGAFKADFREAPQTGGRLLVPCRAKYYLSFLQVLQILPLQTVSIKTYIWYLWYDIYNFLQGPKLHKREKGFNFNAIIVNKFTDRGAGKSKFAKKFGRLVGRQLAANARKQPGK